MTTYEILLMLDPEQAETRQDDIVARTRDLVEKSKGTWHSHDAWGRRRLAYPILHKEEGVYHLVVFDAEAETLEEISRVLKIDDSVLRHMATRHIEGSRTSAPRDDAAAPVAVRPPKRRRPKRQRPKRQRPKRPFRKTASRSTLARKRSPKRNPARKRSKTWRTSTASFS